MIANEIQEKVEKAYDKVSKDIIDLENKVYLESSNRSEVLLSLVRLSAELDIYPNSLLMQRESQASMELATRFANLLKTLLLDFKKPLQSSELTALSLLKRFIADVFECSGLFGTKSVLDLLLRKAESLKGKSVLQNEALIRAIAISSVNEIKPNLLVELSIEKSEIAAMLTLGLLLDRMPIATTGESNRNFLLEQANPYEALSPHNHYKTVVANVWMLCSYSTSPRKHDIKAHLNQWYKRMHAAHKLKPKPLGSVRMPGNKDNKPVMVVMAESFKSDHAMYRWYSPLVKRLKERYFLVMMGLESDVDETSKALFDHFLAVPTTEFEVQPILDTCTPDIVYYPSIGMRSWSISMANMRWAPLQIMGHGHPATSKCDTIDAVLTNSRVFAGKGINSENMLIMEADVGTLISHIDGLQVPPPPDLPTDDIWVAVPCNVMKINFPFMTTLKEIERRADKPVRFTFFPNVAGISYRTIAKRIREFFPTAEVATRNTYQGYLNQLNKHHFALSPFPFGNASTAVDCLLLNMPYIGLIGPEPHSRSDYALLCDFDLEDFLIADSPDTYVEAAVNWINNPEIIQAVKELIASREFINKSLMQTNQHESPWCTEALMAIQWANDNKEALRNQQGEAIFAKGNWL